MGAGHKRAPLLNPPPQVQDHGENHCMTDPKEIIRAAAESIERISLVSSATASATLTSMGVNNTFIDGPVTRTPGRSITGPVLTLQFLPKREDHIAGEGDENVAKQTALWQVLQRVQPGDVIAVDARGQTKTGCFGEMLLTYLAARGGLGIVVDGSIRDSAEATALDIGIWTRGVTPNYATQTTLSPWDFNVPISCGEALVIPGDVVIADDDGAVVVPAALIDKVADKALEHEDWERFSRIKLTEGGDLMKYYPLDEEAQAEFQQWKLSNN